MYKWIGWLTITLLLCVPLKANSAESNWSSYYYLLYHYEGYHKNQEYGECVSFASDLNKDGYDDVVVGVPREEIDGYDCVGRAYAYSGLDGTVLCILQGEQGYGEFGFAVSGIGDTNGDGYGEFLVGAPGAGPDKEGKVCHYSGKEGMLIYKYWGEGPGDGLGRTLDNLGDVDRDGINDFITTAEFYDVNPPPFNIGAVYVYNPVTKELLFKYTGVNSAEGIGLNVSKTGDLNKDGYNDFASLIALNKTPPVEVGVLTLRSGKDGSTIKEFYGTDSFSALREVAYGGDINNDGWPDLLIGQPGKDTASGDDVGCIYVLSGKDLSCFSIVLGTVPAMWLGRALSTAGDIDKDGFDDILVGSSGKNKIGISNGGTVTVYSGRTATVLAEIYGESLAAGLGIAVHGGNDINGDGLPDIIVGSREDVNGIQLAGKAYVYVSKSLKATDEVPLGGILELNLHVPAQPLGFYYMGFALNKESGVPVGTRVLPLSADALLLATLGNPAFSGSLDNKGRRHVAYRMPDHPGLAGLKFYGAFLTMRAGAPCGVGTISNPEEIRLY